jgi:Glutamate synthase domain 1
MCGIAGVINRKGTDVSGTLLEMLSLIQHRGMDASGIAVYGNNEGVVLRAAINDKEKYLVLKNIIAQYGAIASEQIVKNGSQVVFAKINLTIAQKDIPVLHAAINASEDLYVHSLGTGMTVYKDRGKVADLIGHHHIDHKTATHGIGHVRMATESAEDVNAAHPFVSPFYSDLSIVHNGQFTNYYNLRRSLESKKARFRTRNDSEVASHLIAWAMMKNGGDLEDALSYALRELDGIFCIIAATSRQIGCVKDKMGIKPLLLFEQDGMTVFGSEQIEFTRLFPDVYAEELEPGEVRVWNI